MREICTIAKVARISKLLSVDAVTINKSIDEDQQVNETEEARDSSSPRSPAVDNVWEIVIVCTDWRIRRKIIRIVFCAVSFTQLCTQWLCSDMSSSYG